MTRKIILFIFISIIYNNTSYGFMTKNYYTDLGEACENNFTYNKSSNGFDTGAGTTIKTIKLNNCQYKQNNCRIAYFKTGNGICTFPFDHSESTLSAPKSPCSSIGELYAYWAKSFGSNQFYKIKYNEDNQKTFFDYFNCDPNEPTTARTWIDKTCTAGTTFGYYKANKEREDGTNPTGNYTIYPQDKIDIQSFSLTGEYNVLDMAVEPIPCPKGYYCEADKNCFENKIKCPAGHTTDGTGAKSKEECIITDETQFCDKNGCFIAGDLN